MNKFRESIYNGLETLKRKLDFHARAKSVDEFLDKTEGDVHLTSEIRADWPSVFASLIGGASKHNFVIKISAKSNKPVLGFKPFLYHEFEPLTAEGNLFNYRELEKALIPFLQSAEYRMNLLAEDLKNKGRNAIIHN